VADVAPPGRRRAPVFTEVYPRVLVSGTSPADSLTVAGAASGGYSLRALTIVTAILPPGVLAYRGWTYYVFRNRLTGRGST
jgi:cytochrome bd ubiquinol oxidase subunit II